MSHLRFVRVRAQCSWPHVRAGDFLDISIADRFLVLIGSHMRVELRQLFSKQQFKTSRAGHAAIDPAIGNYYSTLGLYRDGGKGNGIYYSIYG